MKFVFGEFEKYSGKGKMLVTSIFSFSHNVFKSHLCQGLISFTPYKLILTHQKQRVFENIVGKGEIARKEQFLLFPQCFLLYRVTVSPFDHIFIFC